MNPEIRPGRSGKETMMHHRNAEKRKTQNAASLALAVTALILTLAVAAGTARSATVVQHTERYGDQVAPAEQQSLPAARPHPRGLPRIARARPRRRPDEEAPDGPDAGAAATPPEGGRCREPGASRFSLDVGLTGGCRYKAATEQRELRPKRRCVNNVVYGEDRAASDVRE